MSVWQFAAAVDGWVKAHDANGDKRMSQAEKDDIWELVNGN